MGKISAVTQALGPVASFLGPAGQIFSAVSTANSLLNKPKQPKAPTPAQAAPFVPRRPGEMARPSELAEYGGMDAMQERSALATRGVNQGLGKTESDYYKNLIQRSLIGEGGQVGGMDSLLPVESQYFSKQGINTSDIMEFLKAIGG